MKKILVLLGNPDKDSYSGSIAGAYTTQAEKSGYSVERINIGDLRFDPVLHKGYKEIQELEPDLKTVQEKILWADHLVIVYPNWWCTMPAILKGMFDRMWLPGFAFNFDKKTKKLIKRLKGKTAHVIVIAGTHSPFITWFKFGDYTNEIQHGILGFAGVRTRVSTFGPTEKMSDDSRKRILKKIESFAKRGA